MLWSVKISYFLSRHATTKRKRLSAVMGGMMPMAALSDGALLIRQ
jgi:hypothetical protein